MQLFFELNVAEEDQTKPAYSRIIGLIYHYASPLAEASSSVFCDQCKGRVSSLTDTLSEWLVEWHI